MLNPTLIGDPHLGRGFKTGVPLHRRGEREARIFSEFQQQLNQKADVICCVGDLFDSPQVSREIVLKTIEVVRLAAGSTPVIVMAGNHDRSRQPEVVSSFDLFKAGVEHVDGVVVVTTPTVIHGVLYMPWQWGVPVLEAVKAIDLTGVHTCIGHHDLESYGGDDSQLYPAAYLKSQGIEHLYGGHWHLAGEYLVDGHVVHCTGSMLPYSHAEDPAGQTYVTLTLEQLEASDPDWLHDKMVRVVAKRGSLIPDVDCLALTTKWEDEAAVDLEVIVGSFELTESLGRSFATHSVPSFVQEFIQERL